MAQGQKQGGPEETNELLKTMLIVQLGMAGVPQQKIRDIVGCDIRRVNAIVKLLKVRGRGSP